MCIAIRVVVGAAAPAAWDAAEVAILVSDTVPPHVARAEVDAILLDLGGGEGLRCFCGEAVPWPALARAAVPAGFPKRRLASNQSNYSK